MANDELVRAIVARVLSAMDVKPEAAFPVEISARHVHLSREHVDSLFGKGRELTPKRPLSQPGQFLCEERVRVIGPSGVIDNVAILGPVRGETQVELSAGDARVLGIAPPVRMSGDLSGAAGVFISQRGTVIEAPGSTIIARRHIHMTPDDARRFGVGDGDETAVRVMGERGLVFEGVPIRVSEQFALAMHIDFDEANACLCAKDATGTIVRRKTGCGPVFTTGGKAVAMVAPTAPPKPAANPVAKRNKVISAEVAQTLNADGGVVRLPRGSIVTPLARDVFNAAKVRVEIVDMIGEEEPCLSVR